MTVAQPLSFAGAALEGTTTVGRAVRSERRVSDYVMVYRKRGSHLSSSPWRGEFEAAKKFARDGLVRRGADECEIRVNTLDGPLVWRQLREAAAMIAGPFKP